MSHSKDPNWGGGDRSCLAVIVGLLFVVGAFLSGQVVAGLLMVIGTIIWVFVAFYWDR